MGIHYKLEAFEGPLDLLLHLIDQAEVDIYDIPITVITEQYLDYIHSMQELDLEPTSEFLVMAATLLLIKSKMLLPKPPVIDLELEDMEEELDPRAELVEKLIEYKKYKDIAEHLRDKELARSLIYSKEPMDLTPFVPEIAENPVKGLHVADLMVAFQKALKKAVNRTSVAKIRRDEISVKDRIHEVIGLLEEQAEHKLLFSKLIEEDGTREQLVVSFLAILELMKMKKVRCYQHRLFEDIVIELRVGDYRDGSSTDEISY
ncbi:segregation and condensation protein A [Marinicrinis lubricantis]|uniref:Segregation and condensation protein A n=1 Tax=Marinicrinis lubricantis TaxID=2086470 RepID=A0ABW1ISI1_9BACL